MMHTDHVSNHRMSSFIAAVYGWMSCALAITAGVAYYIALTPTITHFFVENPMMLFVLFFAQIALVLSIVTLLPRMNFFTAIGIFFLYALSVGITTSSIFFVFELGSIISTFLTTALTFGVMSLYGYLTKTDLTVIGNICIMILMGLVITMLVNMFLQNSTIEYVISGIGVIIFVLLIAYDTQKIKLLAYSPHDQINKLSIIGALTLYLDFINLFFFLLRFMGKRRED